MIPIRDVSFHRTWDNRSGFPQVPVRSISLFTNAQYYYGHSGTAPEIGISIFKRLSCERMQVSVEKAREKLPELIGLVERGELITITRDKIPVADLMPSIGREG